MGAAVAPTSAGVVNMSRPGFTILELLLVVGIIGLLAGLVTALAATVRERARLLDTQQRMESVTTGLAQASSDGGSLAMRLHQEVVGPLLLAAGSPTGVYGFAISRFRSTRVPMIPGPGNSLSNPVGNLGTWLDPDQLPRCCSAVPWGAPWSYPDDPAYPTPRGLALADLTPRASAALLTRAGIIVDPATWRSDHGRSRAWNDAWGNPLLVVIGLYQPPRARSGSAGAAYDRAETAYGRTRAVYVAVGAVGPRPPAEPAGSPEDAADAWWTVVTQRCGAADWASAYGADRALVRDPFTSPPAGWTVGGVRTSSERSLLATPSDLR